MPLPTPNSEESESDFMGRCMIDKTIQSEYDSDEQRAAVCYAQYEKAAAPEVEEEVAAGPWLPRAPRLPRAKWLPGAPWLPAAPWLPPDRGGRRGIPWEKGKATYQTWCLEAQNPSKVDKQNGVIEGISIITTGEAKGHQMMISQKTLESSITLMMGKSIPAYLSHAGSNGDRLLTEAGYFSGFFRDGDQIRASKFTALESFKKYDREKYDRLFEIAEIAPETFGVSIVFEGQLFWEMNDGSEVPMDTMSAPENSRFEYPTVRPLKITSADFVDSPAANGALFSSMGDKSTTGKEMKQKLDIEQAAQELITALGASNESASAAHEAAAEKSEEKPADPPKKKKAKKKELAEQDEEDKKDEQRGEEDEIAKEDQGEEVAKEEDEAEDRDDDEKPDADKLAEDEEKELERPDDEYQEKMRAAVEEVYSHAENLINRLREVMDMTGVPDTRDEAAAKEDEKELSALRARVGELEKLNMGSEPIKESTEQSFADPKDAKNYLIKKHLETHPGDSRSTAVLAVAKTNPELFQNN